MHLNNNLLLAYQQGCQAFHDKVRIQDSPLIHHHWQEMMLYWYEGYCDEEREYLNGQVFDDSSFE